MPAVSQRVDSYLGGVSRQADDKKLPGQVEECINGFPDPTFGLTKRPGFQWIANLGTGTTYDNSKWFYISRTATEKYIGCITPASGGSTGAIAIWNAITGAQATITYANSGNAQAYLTATDTDDYDVLTIQDKSYITNKSITVLEQTVPTFTANTQGIIKLKGVSFPSVSYNITITPSGGSAQTASITTGTDDGYDATLTSLKTAIDNLSIANLTVTKLQDSLFLSRSSGTFTLKGTGGDLNDSVLTFQNEVNSLAELPAQNVHNTLVKILNSGQVSTAYYLKFNANDNVSGEGFWEEARAPDVSGGFTAATMPHELLNTGTNAFTLQRATWINRLVGDNTTNANPTFVGNKLKAAFFHNNRLGFLSGDNVSMSQSGDFFNFYHSSAQIVTDADPIDLSCSTTKPVLLHSILPTTQGLVLFSANQQFMMASRDGVLTPSSTVIRAISNFEMDTLVSPVDAGTSITFISKTPSYTRVFGMITRGEDENPDIADIGRTVNEWIPATMDTLISSPQNQFIAFSGQSSRYIYFFRSYAEDRDTKVEAWFNWEAPGNVQTIAADSDEFYAVTKQANQFTLSKASLSQSPEDAIIVNNDGQRLNPCIDLYATASSVVYDSTNNFSKCFIPYNDATNLTPVLIIKGTTATGQFIESGFTITPERVVESGNTYFKVPAKNLTSIASNVIVGFKYDFDIILPKTYFRIDESMSRSDFTANLTIARMKFSVGLSGVMGFKLKSKGIRQGKREYTGDGSTTVYSWNESDLSYIDSDQVKVKVNNVVSTDFTVTNNTTITFNTAPADGATILIYLDEWYNLNPVIMADQYLANDIAIVDHAVFILPIHQKTDNFTLRLFNDSPFPVSLNSMMWEGLYSPRFYRRT